MFAAADILSLTRTGNQTLSQGEQAYTQARKAQADEALRTWLSRGNLSSTVYGGDFASVNASNLPSIALSLSGGGERAMLCGGATPGFVEPSLNSL